MSRITLQTIANHVGVSRMTVSNAFSRPDQLSPALRARILSAAEELGYAGPDPAARALARGSTGAIGVMLTDSLDVAFTDEIAIGFLGAVAAQLAPTGLALTLLTTSPEPAPVVPARDVAIDGALVYSCDPTSAGTAWLFRRKLPIVLVDQAPRDGVRSVNIDDRAGARAAAQHLIDLGHRQIAILSASAVGPYGLVNEMHALTGSDDVGYVTRQRMLGWTDALAAAGITPIVFQLPPYSTAAEVAAARELLTRAEPPTAILCFSDVAAGQVLQVAREIGRQVPDDLSVVGFDDSPMAARTRPPLTTVRQDVAAKGRAAVTALTSEIARVRRQPAVSTSSRGQADVLLPTELVVRGSTAKPPAASIR